MSNLFAAYNRIPLYLRIVVALLVGIVVGQIMGPSASKFRPISETVLQLLRLLATPLIFVAVLNAIYKSKTSGKQAGKLLYLLMSNTVVAILIGLLVANVIQPGKLVHISSFAEVPPHKSVNIVQDLLDKVPKNLIDPFQQNEVISVILVAVALGFAMRKVGRPVATDISYKGDLQAHGSDDAASASVGVNIIGSVLDATFQLVMVALHWVFALIPLAVFAVVARQVGTDGIKPLIQMLWFVLTVVAALALQTIFYMVRLRCGSWVRPERFLRGATEALVTAFSTASSAATLPITFECATKRIGVREESASLGVMVGGTFNHDGTALYEAMAALFVAQLLGYHLSLPQQVSVVVMSVFASVGAAGIPEAGTVTMIAVFTAVKLPTAYIPLLLPLDWILDRCRTAVNVMGDMIVTCMIDGKTQYTPDTPDEGTPASEATISTSNMNLESVIR